MTFTMPSIVHRGSYTPSILPQQKAEVDHLAARQQHRAAHHLQRVLPPRDDDGIGQRDHRVDALPRGLQGSIWMFAHGGLKILEKIRAVDYDVLAVRPRVTKFDQLRLLAGCLWRNVSRGEALR